MNASAILKGHGWRGEGHSLDHTGRGIVRPLLISHKQDLLGLGKKKPAHNVSDQWWMRAFDESLKELGSGKQTTLGQVRESGISRGGLYGFFVKGEGLQGSISCSEESSVLASNTSTPPCETSIPPASSSETETSEAIADGGHKKRKRDDKPVPRTSKRMKQTAGETKQEKKARKAEDKKTLKTIKAQRRQEKSERKQKKAKEERKKQAERRNSTNVDGVLKGADEIGLNKAKKNSKKKYNSITETKEETKAMELDMPVEEYRAQATAEKGKADRDAKIAAKQLELTSEQQRVYTERAALKGVSLETYILRRIEKKDQKRAKKRI